MSTVTQSAHSPAGAQSSSASTSPDLGLIYALWIRDLMRLRAESSRWIGVVLQPLLFWVVLGAGMGSVFRIEGLSGLDYAEYFFPGVIAMVVLFTTIFATMSVIEDRQTGFLQQVMVVPGRRVSLVLGKTAGVSTVSVIQALLCAFAAPLAGYSVLQIHWPLLVLVLLLASVAMTALNFVMAWMISSTAGYHGIMSVVLLPLWMLSGAMYPASEGWTQWAMTLNPMSYMVEGIRHSLYGGQAPVASCSLSTALIVMVLLAVLGTVFASRVVAKKVAQGRA